jgi:hypothetical protein
MLSCHFDIAHIYLEQFSEPESPGAVRVGAQKRLWFNKCINHLDTFLAAAPPEEPEVGIRVLPFHCATIGVIKGLHVKLSMHLVPC